MASKRFKKLPEKTSDLPSEVIEKLIPEVKKKLYNQIWWVYWFKFSNK